MPIAKVVDRSAVRQDIKARRGVIANLNKQAKAMHRELKAIEKMIAREAATVEKLTARLA